ncbi:hypothetical protein SC08_Contig83orf01957 [Clostridium butyricum]|nr:hypothetical protein SC08_Contig83orf01957 [Clostridium butyricum]
MRIFLIVDNLYYKVSGKNSNYIIGLIKIKIGGVKVAYRF